MKRVASNWLRIREKRAGMVGKDRLRSWEFEIWLKLQPGSRLHVQISNGCMFFFFFSSCSTFLAVHGYILHKKACRQMSPSLFILYVFF